MEKKLLVLFLSNIKFISDEYINTLIRKNKNYHFEFLYGSEDKDEVGIKTHLKIGTFFSTKKFIIMKNYKAISNSTIEYMKKTNNRVWIFFENKSPLFKKLVKTGIFVIKEELYETPQRYKELVSAFSEKFETYDNRITPYMIKLFGKDPNKLVQQMRILTIWKKNITKKDVINFYKDVNEEEIYSLLNFIIEGNKKMIFTTMNKIASEDKIQHLFNYLALVVKDMTKLRLYENIGFHPDALPINWGSKKMYKLIRNKKKISDLATMIVGMEKEQKLRGIKLTKNSFLNSLLLISG